MQEKYINTILVFDISRSNYIYKIALTFFKKKLHKINTSYMQFNKCNNIYS